MRRETDMYQRIKAAFFSPKQLKAYRHDRWSMVLAFLLLMTLIMTLPLAIKLSKQDVMSYETRLSIRTAFRSGENLPFKIENGTLVATSSKSAVTVDLSFITVVVTTADAFTPSGGTTLLLYSDHVSLAQSLMVQELFTYAEHPELEGLDLSLAHEDNADFWSTVFTVVSSTLSSFRARYLVTATLLLLVQVLVKMLFYVLVFTFLQHFFTGALATFGDIFRVACYCYAPTAMLTAIGNLYGVSWLYVIGLLVTLFYLQIAVNAMIQE